MQEIRYIKPIVRYGSPSRLIIPSLNYDREILRGNYDPTSKDWNVSGRGIHYAAISTPPNDYAGSTLIYGHNNPHTFGPLKQLVPGDIAQMITENKLKFTYLYERYEDFGTKNVSILNYDGKPVLSLQTCAGYFNEIRRVYIFNFIKVERL